MHIYDICIGIVDAITCGCLSPHGLGFHQKAGLDSMESGLRISRVKISELMSRYGLALIEGRVPKNSLKNDSNGTPPGVNHVLNPTPLPQSSLAYSLLEEIGIETLKYESALISVCRRRVFAISQVCI
jgi:hypothetical protein